MKFNVFCRGTVNILTAVVTLSDKLLNCGEDLFPSSDIKFCSILNPNLIFASGGEVAIVVASKTVVLVAIVGAEDVAVTWGAVTLPVSE